MGGIQAILSVALILEPVLAGLAFDHAGVTAPYLLGGFLAALALLVAAKSLSGSGQRERNLEGSGA